MVAERILEFLLLATLAKKICDSKAADWELKYELIFSPEISDRVRALGLEPDYADPDGSYEDDVRAYVEALTSKADQIRGALGMEQG